MVCVDETVLHMNSLELTVVVRPNSEAAGMPEPPVRVSNPTSRGRVLVAGLAIETVIAPPVAAVADIERNWSLFIVVVEVTYAAGMV